MDEDLGLYKGLMQLCVEEKFGQYIEVIKGKQYDIFVQNVDSDDLTITASMVPEATGIVLEKTTLAGYVGMQVWVEFETEPVGSIAEYQVSVEDETIAKWWGASDNRVSFYGYQEGHTTATVTVGDKNYTIELYFEDPKLLTEGVNEITINPGEEIAFEFTPHEDGDYFLCMPKDLQDIYFSGQNTNGFRNSGTAEYSRILLESLYTGTSYLMTFTNEGDVPQTFTLNIGKAVPATEGDLTISGPTEVDFGATEIMWQLNVPMFVDYGWIQWDVSDWNILSMNQQDGWYVVMDAYAAGTVTITANSGVGAEVTHTVRVKEYGEDAVGKWSGDAQDNAVSFTFTPERDGYYLLHGQFMNGALPVLTEAGDQAIFSFECVYNVYSGVVYQLEAGKTYHTNF